jgi:hypothetical protein
MFPELSNVSKSNCPETALHEFPVKHNQEVVLETGDFKLKWPTHPVTSPVFQCGLLEC